MPEKPLWPNVIFYGLFWFFVILAIVFLCIKMFWLQVIFWLLAFLCKIVAEKIYPASISLPYQKK